MSGSLTIYQVKLRELQLVKKTINKADLFKKWEKQVKSWNVLRKQIVWRTRGRINFSTRGHLLLKVSSKIWALRGFQRFSGTRVSPHGRTAVIFLFLLPFPSHTYQQQIKCVTAMRVKILFCISSLSNGFECPGFLFAAYFHTSACRYPCTVVSPSCCYWRKPHNKVFISVYLHQQLCVDVDNFREGKVL